MSTRLQEKGALPKSSQEVKRPPRAVGDSLVWGGELPPAEGRAGAPKCNHRPWAIEWCVAWDADGNVPKGESRGFVTLFDLSTPEELAAAMAKVWNSKKQPKVNYDPKKPDTIGFDNLGPVTQIELIPYKKNDVQNPVKVPANKTVEIIKPLTGNPLKARFDQPPQP